MPMIAYRRTEGVKYKSKSSIFLRYVLQTNYTNNSGHVARVHPIHYKLINVHNRHDSHR